MMLQSLPDAMLNMFIKSAFCLLPVHLMDFDLLKTIEGAYYYINLCLRVALFPVTCLSASAPSWNGAFQKDTME